MQNMGTALQSTNWLLLLQKPDVVLHLLCSSIRNVLAGPARQQLSGSSPLWGIIDVCIYFLFLLAKIFFLNDYYFPKLNCCVTVGKKWKVLSTLVSISMTSTCCCSNLVSVFHLMKPSKSLKRKSSWVWSDRVFFPDIPSNWASGFFHSSINNCDFIFLWKYLRPADHILWFDGL